MTDRAVCDIRAIANPKLREIRQEKALGTIHQAARAAGVKPGTIRVWMTRGKIRPVDFGDDGPELFHLPTAALLGAAGREHPSQRAPRAA